MLCIVAGVLATAWFAGRDGAAVGLAVAFVGLAAIWWRPVLGIPAAVAIAAAAAFAPALAVVATVVVALLTLTTAYARFAFGVGPVQESNIQPPGPGGFGL
jgi:hypothetical protein